MPQFTLEDLAKIVAVRAIRRRCSGSDRRRGAPSHVSTDRATSEQVAAVGSPSMCLAAAMREDFPPGTVTGNPPRVDRHHDALVAEFFRGARDEGAVGDRRGVD